MAIVDKTHKIYTDQTGKFPITSSRGNKYILIMYVYDSNAILGSPLKSRSSSQILEAYTKQVEHLTTKAYIPQVHWLDHEASAILNKYNKNKYIEYQLVSSYIHGVNAAERAIRVWKNHLLVGISKIDTRFPMHLWCLIIPQATMKLNIMRPCRKTQLFRNTQHWRKSLTSTRHILHHLG